MSATASDNSISDLPGSEHLTKRFVFPSLKQNTLALTTFFYTSQQGRNSHHY
jgi:hypothetical protein